VEGSCYGLCQSFIVSLMCTRKQLSVDKLSSEKKKLALQEFEVPSQQLPWGSKET
jgi:hypothetical protein